MTFLCKRIRNAGRLFSLLNSNEWQVLHVNSKFASTGKPSAPRDFFRLSVIGVGVGAIVGTGYTIHQLNKTTTHILNEQTVVPVIPEIPHFTPSRQIRYSDDQSGLNLTLFQYQTCPFCCKVRAFLDYHGISYDVIEVDPVLRQSIKWSQYKKVPIMLAKVDGGYQPLNDSSMIISAVTSYLQDKESSLIDIVRCYPSISFFDEKGSKKVDVMNKYFLMYNGQDPKRRKEEMDEERKWRKWVDDVFVHMLSPNVYRTPEEALQAFHWFSETGDWEKHFPTWERYLIIYVGAFAMWLIGKRLKTRYQLNDNVRLSLYEECDNWSRAVESKGTQFLGGKVPNLADLSVYGVLSSIEGCNAFHDLLKNSEIKNWYYSMKEAIRNRVGNADAVIFA